MKRSESIAKIALALAKAQGEFPSIPKTKTATVRSDKGSFSYDYADLADVISAVSPVLAKHEIAAVQSVMAEGDKVSVVTLLAHSSGEWIELDPLTLKADSAQPQKLGGATTYGRRYALGGALNIAPEADDDSNAAQGQEATTTRKPSTRAEGVKAKVAAANGHRPDPIAVFKETALKEATEILGDVAQAKAWICGVREDPKASRPWTDEDCLKITASLTLLRAKSNQNGSDEWNLETNP